MATIRVIFGLFASCCLLMSLCWVAKLWGLGPGAWPSQNTGSLLAGGISARSIVPDQFVSQLIAQQEQQKQQEASLSSVGGEAAPGQDTRSRSVDANLDADMDREHDGAASQDTSEGSDDIDECGQGWLGARESSSGSGSSESSRDQGKLWYQQGLSDFLHSSGQSVSPYNSNLVYSNLVADGRLLREYLRRAGTPVPDQEAYR